jgi:hypothetical protein
VLCSPASSRLPPGQEEAPAPERPLLWGLAISNLLVFVDPVMFPDVNLYRWRFATAAVAMILLLYGLIWESE